MSRPAKGAQNALFSIAAMNHFTLAIGHFCIKTSPTGAAP